MKNAEIASKLSQLAQLLQHQGENRYKIKAYRNAAEILKSHSRSVHELLNAGDDLTEIPGIGKGIAAAIAEIVKSGTLGTLNTLAAKIPVGVLEIAQTFDLSVKEAQRVTKLLKVDSAAALEKKLSDGRSESLLGVRLAYKLKQSRSGAKRLLWDAEPIAKAIVDYLLETPEIEKVEIAGSIRRKKDTVGSIRLVVVGSRNAAVKALKRYGGADNVSISHDDSLQATLASGLPLYLKITKPQALGSALVEFTGSASHVAALTTGRKQSKRRAYAATSEADYYRHIGLSYIEPELRENRGEIKAALKAQLPALIDLSEIRGDLHMHTTASDGSASLNTMARAAQEKGYEYIGITDHSQSLTITNGLTPARLRKQGLAIDSLSSRCKGFRIFKSSEVDILEDGRLDFSPAVLRSLDYTICSIHSRFGLDEKRQTERLLTAIANPYCTIIGHLTGRLLLKRPGYELNISKILKAVKKFGKILEINSSPDRLDISDEVGKEAAAMGIPIVVNTDAHRVGELDFMRAGISQARRAWLKKSDVINTYPLRDLLRRLKSIRKDALAK